MSQSTDVAKTGTQFTGHKMLAVMLSFFGVIIAVNMTMAWFATNSWTGLVVKNSYVASQEYNAHLAQARAQTKRGWQSSLSYADGVIRFRLSDRAGAPLDLERHQIKLGRPAFEQEDIETTLQRVKPGIYELKQTLNPGTWAIRIAGSVGDHRFRRDTRLFVPLSESAADGH